MNNRARRAVEQAMDDDKTVYQVGHGSVRALRAAMVAHGASDGELNAVDRLDRFEGRREDVERLAPLARLAGLPWDDLFPGLGGA